LKSKFEHYSQIRLMNGKSGREIAEAMLHHYGIMDVKVVSVPGFLSDHYNPMDKTVNLSPDVFEGRTIAAAAVAAHECGHAVQHATAYSMLKMRSAIVPIVNIASTGLQFAMAIAFVTLSSMPQIMLITILLFAVTTAFSLITLPVEFDASNRAMAWLKESNMAVGEENEGVKDALWWAAMTYVSAALSSLVMLVYLILRYKSATRN
jgi:Zn-dependent membrane protease YugP